MKRSLAMCVLSVILLFSFALGAVLSAEAPPVFLGTWGWGGVDDGAFNFPIGVAVGPDGMVYVADRNNHRIQKFGPTGEFITKWGDYGTGNGQFYEPNGVAVGPYGAIYVTDTMNHRIQKFTASGVFVTKWGSYGTSDGQFRYPDYLAVGPDGSVYVGDRGNQRIQKFTPDGALITKWGSYGTDDGQFNDLKGVAVSPDGSVYVADLWNYRIQKFTSDGAFITKWGSYGSGDGQFKNPCGLAVGPDGSVYVADSGNHRAQKFTASGEFLTKWGTYGFGGDGQFLNTADVAVSPDGTVIYVVDFGYCRIQYFGEAPPTPTPTSTSTPTRTPTPTPTSTPTLPPAPVPTAVPGEPLCWRETVISTADPFYWSYRYLMEVGDANNDGKTDITLGSEMNWWAPRMAFYQRSGSTWTSEFIVSESLTYNAIAGTVIGDADNDGLNELLYGLHMQSNANGGPLLMKKWIDGAWSTSVVFDGIGDWSIPWAVADVDGNGTNEIIASVDTYGGGGTLMEPWVFRYNGGWNHESLSSIRANGADDMVAADADGDGRVEILRIYKPSLGYSIMEWDGAWQETDFMPLPSDAFDFLGFYSPSPTEAGDVDGDGLAEFVLVYWRDSDHDGIREAHDDSVVVRVVDYAAGAWNASDFIAYPVLGTFGSVALAVGDANNDGRDEIYLADEDGFIRMYSYISGAWHESVIDVNRSVRWWDAKISDVDNDGDQDLVLVGKSADGSTFILAAYQFLPCGAMPPTVSAGGPYTGNEGDGITLDGAGATDPDGDVLTYAWSADSPLCSFSDATILNPVLTCMDDGHFTATLEVSDGIADPVTSVAAVAVLNVAPVVDVGADATINEGDTFSQIGIFSDPGADTWTATVDYGDGSGVQSLALVGKTFVLNHTYADDGVYDVVVCVSDGDSGVGCSITNPAPGPERIAFVSSRDGDYEIYVMDVDGSNVRRLTNRPGLDMGPLWSPDGTRITYTKDYEVWVMDAEEGDATATLLSDIWPSGPNGWSPDGSKVLFMTEGQSNPQLWVVPSDGSAPPAQLTNVCGGATGDWSRDGQTIVFSSGLETCNDHMTTRHLYLMNPDGSDIRPLLDLDGNGLKIVGNHPRWSPDGQQIAFSVYNNPPAHNWDIYVVNRDGSGLRALLAETSAGDVWPHWSPDGQYILFSSFSRGGIDLGLWMVRADGQGQPLPVMLEPGENSGGDWWGPGGQPSMDQMTVTVVNVAPSVNAGADATINEGDTFSQSGSFIDPGADTWTATVDYGDGSGIQPLALVGKTFQLNHTYADDGVYIAEVCVADDDGGVGCDPVNVTILNVAPVVNIGPDATINEGDTFSQSGSFTDPGADTWTATVDYGDGTDAQLLALVGKTFRLNHTYADNGVYNVVVCVTDDDGDPGYDYVTLTVLNVAPTASFANASGTIDEGQAATLTFADQFDPGPVDTLAGFLYSYDCTNDSVFEVTDTPSSSYACTYADNGSFTARGRIKDKDGGYTDYTAGVTVLNVAPMVGPITAPVDPVQVGIPVNASADFTDPGVLDTHTALWDWGDGGVSGGDIIQADGSGTVGGNHTYVTPGVYTVKVTVTDKDGDYGESYFRYVVIFDPEGGFVTGGGWINSPLGAYAPDPTLTGKATFGFVSKYNKGATVPTGQTQFQFRVANLNFHSEVYQWLVVAGPKAQFKGSGTINGGGDYGFILTAIDGQVNGGGGVDKFRIKIWDKSTGAIIYDNLMGAPDDTDPTTIIGGGSIVIHKG